MLTSATRRILAILAFALVCEGLADPANAPDDRIEDGKIEPAKPFAAAVLGSKHGAVPGAAVWGSEHGAVPGAATFSSAHRKLVSGAL